MTSPTLFGKTGGHTGSSFTSGSRMDRVRVSAVGVSQIFTLNSGGRGFVGSDAGAATAGAAGGAGGGGGGGGAGFTLGALGASAGTLAFRAAPRSARERRGCCLSLRVGRVVFVVTIVLLS